MNKKDFLEIVEGFLRKSGMKATPFGVAAAGEPNFVFLLRSGRECREEKVNRVLEYIRKQGGASIEGEKHFPAD